MQGFWDFAGHYWWLAFLFGGSISAGFKAVGAANSRRAERRQERYRLRQQVKLAELEAAGHTRQRAETQRGEADAALALHDRTNDRWFAYETDLATLLHAPLMVDMREPLTLEFHRAKSLADSLRPASADQLVGDRTRLDRYATAVRHYAAAFDVAEAEAKRRKHYGFSATEQERLTRAQRLLALALDEAATPAERQSAYARVRRELDGLITIPPRAAAALESRVGLALES